MCPEVQISKTEASKLNTWMIQKSRVVLSDPNAEALQHIGGYDIFMVEGEPLIVYSRRTPKPPIQILFCSNEHARQLEKAGIIEFPKRPVE